MEDLTKQQIVLLTLLVSFVTSLATGIITVSLMDQGTFGITQVVNQIVEREVIKNVPAAVAETTPTTPSLSQITAQLSKGIVRLKPANGSVDSIIGIGLILSRDGLIVTDKTAVSDGVVAILPGGQEVPIQVIQSEILGDIAFATLLLSTGTVLSPVIPQSNVSSTKLGDDVYALTGKRTAVLEKGIMKKLAPSDKDRYDTTINPAEVLVGSPLFNLNGEVLGIKTNTYKETSEFYPLAPLKSLAPQVTR
jgi:S1-C subfamily serine protease